MTYQAAFYVLTVVIKVKAKEKTLSLFFLAFEYGGVYVIQVLI